MIDYYRDIKMVTLKNYQNIWHRWNLKTEIYWITNTSGINRRASHSSSRVTLSVSFIFGCIPGQISVRFRETCFQFRVQARVRRARAFSLSIYESVTLQRVAMQCNATRHSARLTDSQTDSRIVRICVQTTAVFRRSLGIARISKSTLLRVALESRMWRNANSCSRFLTIVHTSVRHVKRTFPLREIERTALCLVFILY